MSRTKLQNLHDIIQKRQLNFLSHILRLPPQRPAYDIGSQKVGIERLIYLFTRPRQHDNGYMGGRSQIKVRTDERTQVHSAQSSLAVIHPRTNRARVT